MSELIKIEGLPEETFNHFWGGVERRSSLQITVGKEYVQLGQDQVIELAGKLQEIWGPNKEQEIVDLMTARVFDVFKELVQGTIRNTLFPTPPATRMAMPVVGGIPVEKPEAENEP